MQIDLTLEEITLLTELLHGDAGNLREEIYKTDDRSFKAELQAREKLMKATGEALRLPRSLRPRRLRPRRARETAFYI